MLYIAIIKYKHLYLIGETFVRQTFATIQYLGRYSGYSDEATCLQLWLVTSYKQNGSPHWCRRNL